MLAWWHDLSWVIPLRSEALTVVFAFFTLLGSLNAYILIILLMAWLWQSGLINRLLPWVGVSVISNSWAKMYFADARPGSDFLMTDHAANGFGLPSGHAQLAVLFWGALSVQLFRISATRWLAWSAIGVAVLISFSRLYLGVHDVEDVTIGALIGVTLLSLFRLTDARLPLPRPVMVIASFSVFAAIAFATWPQGGGLDVVVPAMALVISWFGTLWLGRSLQHILQGSMPVQWTAALAGIFVVLALNVGVSQFFVDWHAQAVLLCCAGCLGVLWPRIVGKVMTA
jgi:membrane-associated phospholipid phosphatase